MNLVLFGGFVYDAWMTIVFALNWLTYNIIEILYRVFVAVANVNLFGKDIFEAFTKRMYIVVGMAMLFIFAYNIILMIINPEDKKGTGQMSKAVKETIISLVLVILLPTIFNYMAIFQKNVLDSQIISKIILDTGTGEDGENFDCNFSNCKSLEKLDDTISINKLETSCKNYYDNKKTSPSVRGAYLMTPTLLNAFLYPVNYSMDSCENFIKSCNKEKLTECDSSKIKDEKDRELCGRFFYSFKMSQYNGSIGYLLNRAYFKDVLKDEDQEILNFNYLYSLVGGILTIVMFASYTIMIGVRVAKLGFLEIIAPIPVMMRIIPKQKEALYDKWFNQLKNTYLDLFIRMIIINFALYAITLIPDVINQLGGSGDDNIVVVGLAKAVVILGILQFAKEAPSLIKEFFGSSGRFSIKGGLDQWKSAGKTISKPIGMGVGAIGGGLVGTSRNVAKGKGWGKLPSGIGGFVGGTLRGAKNGFKGGLLKSGQNISTTADEVEAAREKHRATRAAGEINGRVIPGVSNVVGTYRNIETGVGEGLSDLGDFMTGSVASSERGTAANEIMSRIDNIENTFSNATIANIKAGRTEIMKNYNADKDFDFDGEHYHKISATEWKKTDANGNVTTVNDAGGDVGKNINKSFKNRIAAAYAQNELKDNIKDGFDRANTELMKRIREDLPKLGNDFADKLFEKLNKSDMTDINGRPMNLDIHTMDDLENRLKDLMDNTGKSDIQQNIDMASVYKIHDEIKTATKGIGISNKIAVEAQQAKKNQKDSNKK